MFKFGAEEIERLFSGNCPIIPFMFCKRRKCKRCIHAIVFLMREDDNLDEIMKFIEWSWRRWRYNPPYVC